MYGSSVTDRVDLHALNSMVEYWINSAATKRDFEVARGKALQNRIVAIMYRVSQQKVLGLINNRTKVFCPIFKIFSVSDWCEINLDFDMPLLKIEQILTELQELEDQNAVNHETNDLFHSGCYMM